MTPRTRLHHLYREFAAYYTKERCDWAPTNPRRVFNLAYKAVYPAYRDRLTATEFLGVVYATLGIPMREPPDGTKADPPGLFETFDPARYTGDKPVADHFVNLFRVKLRGNADKVLRRTTDRGRWGDRETYSPRPELGLLNTTVTAASVEFDDLITGVLKAMSTLDDDEWQVLRLVYWDDLSDRQAGERLGIDHKTVRRRHDRSLRKLRAYYGVAA